MIDDQFFKDIGMDDIDPKQKEELLDQLSELVENEMAQKLTTVLTDEQMEHFDALLEEDKDEEAYDYLLEVFPAYPAELQEAADRVKQAFVADMEGLIQQVADKVTSEGEAKAAPADPVASAAPAITAAEAAAEEVTVNADGTLSQGDAGIAHQEPVSDQVGDLPPVPATLADTPQHVNDVPSVEPAKATPEPIAPGEGLPVVTEPIAPGETVAPVDPTTPAPVAPQNSPLPPQAPPAP